MSTCRVAHKLLPKAIKEICLYGFQFLNSNKQEQANKRQFKRVCKQLKQALGIGNSQRYLFSNDHATNRHGNKIHQRIELKSQY